MNTKASPVTANPWETLRRFTDARIALGRAGVSLPTAAHLAFQLAHAQARDAVLVALDVPSLRQSLSAVSGKQPCLSLHSAAADRTVYLQRPDLGRRLDEASRKTLQELKATGPEAGARPFDVAFVVVDGLSALAIMQHAAPFLGVLQRRIAAENWSVAPVCIASQGRVAIGDEVGELLGARAVVVLIGERPGLSSPDSMGLYLTWMPRAGLLDDSRNCISNVRPAGLRYEDAAYKLHYLLAQAHKRQLSGVGLKDETLAAPQLQAAMPKNFLLDHSPTLGVSGVSGASGPQA
ncbi:MAG: ethanolamine ammonia-lyase subunit EutC [Burkholderiales bacterium]|nr:ethanolamine ammonia-lyase subunit EutC [Burkholderiales bacterium]